MLQNKNLESVAITDATADEIREFLNLNGIEGVSDGDSLAVLRRKAKEAGVTQIIRLAHSLKVEYEKKVRSQRPDRPYNGSPLTERWCSITLHQEMENDSLGRNEPLFVAVNDVNCWIPRNVRVCVREMIYEVIRTATEIRYPPLDDGPTMRKFDVNDGFEVQHVPHTFHGYKDGQNVMHGIPDLVKGEILIAPHGNDEATAHALQMQNERALHHASQDVTASQV